MSSANIYADNHQLQIVGELNFISVMTIWEQSLALLPTLSSILIDFSRVTSTNSAGLALIMEWKKYALTHKRNCVFMNIPSQLTHLANLCGLKLN